MKRRLVLFLFAACLGAAGLTTPWGGTPAYAAAPDESHPQPELPKEPLIIASRDGKTHLFHVEMALTEQQQIVGLMQRPRVPEDGGMLFVWDQPMESQMWMKNTLAPLDMVFIDTNGTIHRIAENTVPQSLAIIKSNGEVKATLELAGGVTRKLNIRVGDKVQQRVFNNMQAQPVSGGPQAVPTQTPAPAPAVK